jgi:CheY-like chemotaxis protein
MIHGLAEQLGGAFTLHSVLDEGTEATLLLPVASAGSLPVKAQQTSADIVADLPSLKILAVDDDGLILMNTVALLEDLGHEVLEAISGQEALELIGENPDLDLLITDQAMPKMTGTQLADLVTLEHAIFRSSSPVAMLNSLKVASRASSGWASPSRKRCWSRPSFRP